MKYVRATCVGVIIDTVIDLNKLTIGLQGQALVKMAHHFFIRQQKSNVSMLPHFVLFQHNMTLTNLVKVG